MLLILNSDLVYNEGAVQNWYCYNHWEHVAGVAAQIEIHRYLYKYPGTRYNVSNSVLKHNILEY